MEPDRVEELIRSSALGRDLRRRERARLARIGTCRDVPTGTAWCREGQPTAALGIVQAGRLALRLHVPERGLATILTVEPGDIVGWSAVVAPYRATTTAVAQEPSQVLELDAVALRAALDEDPELAAAVYSHILGAVSRRLHGTRLQLLDLFRAPEEEAW